MGACSLYGRPSLTRQLDKPLNGLDKYRKGEGEQEDPVDESRHDFGSVPAIRKLVLKMGTCQHIHSTSFFDYSPYRIPHDSEQV